MSEDQITVTETIMGDDLDDEDAVEVSLKTDVEWARGGTNFRPQPTADMCPVLPSGIYRFIPPTQTSPWYLSRTAARFEFPFKVYSASDSIIQRIAQKWVTEGGNLGVLLNGLRGAGKTMTAQLLANQLIRDLKLPCLVVRNPIPLQLIFDSVQQDMIVIFDEFEKTHNEEIHPGCQQQLLSTIDGMSRSSHNRLVLFTTNSPRVNENFRDRPSRIHYKFEFNRVDDSIIEGLINDSLPQKYMHFKPDILEYLNSRDICTIDIVKSVIGEVSTFGESPREFEDMLNIQKAEPPAFDISILDENDSVVRTYASYFKVTRGQDWISLLLGNKRTIERMEQRGHNVDFHSSTWNGSKVVRILEYEGALEDGEGHIFKANLQVPKDNTIWSPFSFLYKNQFWIDNKPKDWSFPYTYTSSQDPEVRTEIEGRYEESTNAGTIYGTGQMAVIRILVVPNHTKITSAPERYKANYDFSAEV